jgi:hypothetical protein
MQGRKNGAGTKGLSSHKKALYQAGQVFSLPYPSTLLLIPHWSKLSLVANHWPKGTSIAKIALTKNDSSMGSGNMGVRIELWFC